MPNISRRDFQFLSAVARLAYTNPFVPERVELEKAALGAQFTAGGPVWSASVRDPEATPPNVAAISAKLEPAIERAHAALTAAREVSDEELLVYEESLHYFLYQRYYPQFVGASHRFPAYRRFLEDWNHFCHLQGKTFRSALDPQHVFACFRQIQNAFQHIYNNIIGNSMPAARLRASVWQSIFTHDMRRYRRTMYRRMAEFPTLITGPSGSGKELIARAIAGSRYVPFDANRLEFADARSESFVAINIASLSPALIESELFGHRRGAFTGAVGDRKGWLEVCPQSGSVFLDELGEMDLSIQVKMLRVIETRRFSAVGDTSVREFRGKLIAATNRELPDEISAGRFREDLYYRLCADQIRTPSLSDQIRDTPEVLDELLHYMTRRTAAEETNDCLPEVRAWVRTNLPAGYEWPGNYRELEQCVRNIIIRHSYRPMERTAKDRDDDLLRRFQNAEMTADELLARYAAQVYRVTGSYEESARRMGLDRRTVKAKVEAFVRGA